MGPVPSSPPVAAALALAALALGATAACADAEAPSAAPESVRVLLGDEIFVLELAVDPATRQRGLSERPFIPPHGGMLFVFPRAKLHAMVMRDCPVPLDVAFLDARGRVVAVHDMKTEPPRRQGESDFDYESRLPVYPSGGPALFAVETAAGRLAEVGLAVGQRVELDARALARLAR